MLTIKDFTTDHENLVNLLSVATYGNEWPVVKAFKSDSDKGLFNDCECREDKWAKALMHGKGLMVYDTYDEEVDWDEMDDISQFPQSAKHHITLDDVRKGLELMRDNYPRHWADLVEEQDDLITGDVFLQLATFGELIYG
jgi:hypothetical protein